ncbi:hypothetical protein NMG60_11017983 [Bertholletia excelsa]
MDEKMPIKSCLNLPEDKIDSLYPIFFGVSSAFFALRLLSGPDKNPKKWLEIRTGLLLGSSYLLGLMVWRINCEKCGILEKLENAKREIEELKRRRTEDAKANEKVVGIFAAKQQIWLSERKKLRQQIGALVNEVRVLQTKRDKTITELEDKLLNQGLLLQCKENVLEAEDQKRRDLEEKLKEARNVADELRDTAKHDAQEHSLELRKHRAAFIELVSNQRQLEAEMGRALRQVEAAKEELYSVLAMKEESVLISEKLTMELIEMQKELQQKNNILSAMLRKSKLDPVKKQELLKEVKLLKAKAKPTEKALEKTRTVSESKHERRLLKSLLSKNSSSKLEAISDGGRNRSDSMDFLLQYTPPAKHQKEYEFWPSLIQHTHRGIKERDNVKQLEGRAQSEAEKCTIFKQQHHLELNAFAEQLRLMDEKIEAFHQQLSSMELESKQLYSHIEELNLNLSLLKQENSKLHALLLELEDEIHPLKQQRIDSKAWLHDLALDPETLWSKVKIVKTKRGEKEPEIRIISEKEAPSTYLPKDLSVHSREKDLQEDKDVVVDPGSVQNVHASPEEADIVEKSELLSPCLSKNVISPWRKDLHSLGVFYKIKMLKQQLLMLERLIGEQENCQDGEGDDNVTAGWNGFHKLMLLLNKQVNRYQSLQGKADEICKQMHEINMNTENGGSAISRTEEETKTLKNYLEETFHLQRYIVATGQKLMQMQPKMASGFMEAAEELDGLVSFDPKRFADSVSTLLWEVQRGIEVRIARIIGDAEGTLACDEIIHSRK